MDAASAIAPVQEHHAGSLATQARSAQLPRMERIMSVLRTQGMLQEVGPREPGAARADETPASKAEGRAYAQMQAGEIAAQGGRQYKPFTVTDVYPGKPGLQGNIPEGRDGDRLREVATEMRSLRAEISTLSRMLGYPTRQFPANRGILQQHDQLDSDVQLEGFRQAEVARQGRADAALARRDEERVRMRQLTAEMEAGRIQDAQRALIRTLERAQKHLAESPESIPQILREQIIGEIYRARYNITLFGGLRGLAGLRLNSVV